jgi:translation initiation factor 2A
MSIDLNGVNVNGKKNSDASPKLPEAPPIDTGLLSPVTPGLDNSLDPIAKKVRNLNKKLKAIEELKEKAKRGERLEATQMKKMEGEVEIRKELKDLGVV